MRLNRVSLFTVLMVAALVTATLPTRWTAWSGRVMQPLAWAQYLGGWLTRRPVELVEDQLLEGRSVPLREYLALEDQLADLRRQLRHQTLSLQALGERIDELTGLRDQLRDASARIISARVLSGDSSSERETLTISVGQLRGVEVGDWVVAGQRIADASATGREVVWRQWLVGQISEVQPHVSRVRLATDRSFGPIQVVIGRTGDDGRPVLAEDICVLQGLGGGRMVIRQATEDYLAAGYTFAAVRLPAAVPLALTIGELTASRVRTDSPMHHDLELHPPGRVASQTMAYVLRFD